MSPTSTRRFFISSHFSATKYSSKVANCVGMREMLLKTNLSLHPVTPRKANEVEIICGTTRPEFQLRTKRTSTASSTLIEPYVLTASIRKASSPTSSPESPTIRSTGSANCPPWNGKSVAASCGPITRGRQITHTHICLRQQDQSLGTTAMGAARVTPSQVHNSSALRSRRF